MKNSDFDKLWGNQPDSDEFDRLWTGVDSYTPKVVNNPSPYPQNTTPAPVNTPTPQPTTVTPQPTTYAISRDGFAMDEDLIAEYGTYDNYLKSHPLNEFQFKTDDAGSGTSLKTKYGTYENYQDNVVTDDYYKQVENTANTKLAWGYDPNRQTVEAAKTELKSLTSLSQAAAAKGMTIEQYQKWQQDKNYVDDLAKKAEEAFVPVQVAAQDLERLQGEIDALLAPNYGAGNIDLSATPRFDNGDGTYSTVDSISFHDDKTGLEILIPTVIQTENGWEHVSAAQAIEQYRKTGNYLGAFRTVEEANTYANQLHEQQEDLFARWSELSAQYQAAAEMYRNLNDEFQNGIYAGLQAANDNYLIAYDPTQYYLNNGIDYAGIMDTIGALDAYISTLPAGSDRYVTEQRRRNSLYAHRMAFATDEELKDIYAGYGYKSSYEADPEEYAKRVDELAELNARKRELDGLKAIGAEIDEAEYEQLAEDIKQAESNGPKSSKNKELRDAAGMEIARRDAEKILDQIMKQANTDAVQYLDLLATYSTSGVIPADKLVEIGIPWQAVQAYTPDQLANVTKSALVKAGIDKQAAANTVETILREGNAKATSMMLEDFSQLAESGAPGRIAATVLSFGSNVYSGLGMLEGIRAATNGSTIKFADPNSAYFGAANMTNALRSGVTDAVDWKVGQVDLFDTAYGILTSSVDSMLAAYMGGPVGGTLIGTQAAAQAMLETTQNGGSLSEAVTTGVVAGIFESLFETISIGQFQRLQEKDIAAGSIKELLSKGTVGEFSKNLLKSFFVNASEEMATEAANIIFDYMKGTPSSNYVRAIAEVKTQINPDTKDIYTDEEAKAKVAKDLAWQVAEAGITGGLQGILMGTVAQLGAFKTVKELRSLVHISSEQAGVVHTICVGETYNQASDSFKKAQALSQKLKAAIKEGKTAVTRFFQENQQAFADLEKSVADEMKDYAPANYTPEVYKAAKESVVKGDATPPHIETPTETRIRDVQTAVGMTEEEAKATQSLLYSLVNGNGKLDTDAAQKAKLLNSDAFKRAVYELTGMQVEGSSNSEIRHSLNEIARQIRESDTVDLNPVDVPMQAQDNLVPAENPGNFSFLSSVISKLGQESQNAADTTVAPTTNDQLGTTVAEGPVTGAYEGGGGNELLSYVMGNLTRNDQTGAGLADMQAPVQQQMGEPAPAQTVEPVAPAQPAQPAQTVTPREGKTRFSVADNITDTGTRPITKEQHLTEQILNTMLSGSGLQVKVVSGDPSLTGATGRYSNGVLYVNGDLRSANTFNGIAWVVGHEMVHAVEERTGTGEGGAVNKIMSTMQALAKEGVLSEEWLKVATDKDAMNALEDEYRNTYRTFLTNKYMREGYSPNDALVKANNEVEGEAGLTYVRGEIAADFMGSILGYRAAKEKTGYGSPKVNRMDALLKLANVDRGLVQDAASSVMDMRDKLGSGAQAREERGALNNLLLDIGQALYFSKDENEESGTRFSAAELEDMSFADQIDLACQGKIRKEDAMRIGRTRGILRELGLTSNDQHMTQGKFFLSTYGTEGELAPVEGYDDTKENSNTHMVTYDTMEHLPELLEDPVMVYLSRHDDGSEIIVVTEDVDKEGFPVLAVINPDGYAYVGGEKLPSNFVESVYGAFSFVENYQSGQKYSTLQTIVREGLLMWADEEKSRNLIQRYRDRFSVSRTSDNRGNQRNNSDPLSGFVFNQIIQKWNPEVKSFDRDHNVMQPIRNSDTGRTYGNANEFVEDAKAEAANQNLRYDGYVIRLDNKGDKYTAYALDRNGKTVELYHGVGLEEITEEKRADKPVLNGGGNAEIRVFSPNEHSSVSVFTSDYKTENDDRALLIESSKTDGTDRRSDYALQRELERAAREGYDLLLWADANAQMNVANPYSTQDKDGQVTGQKSLTNIYDKGFSDYYGKYGEVETFYLPDAKQSVAPERYLELQSERATLMQQIDEARKQATEGQQADAEAQLRARQLQNKLIDVNAEMSEIRNKDEKVEQKGAAVPGIRITDEIRNQFSERYSVAGENSAIADLDALDRAIKYSKRKKDANWIYDRTGWWFDPNDGKWRFEIADNEARFIRTADESRALKDPQYAALRSEYRDLSQKSRRGNLTQAERARLDEIGPQYLEQRTKLQSDFRRNGGKLEDVLQHDTLFQSYPELRDYTVIFSDLPDDTYGATNPGGKVIEINKRLKNDPEFRRRAAESKGLSDTSIDTAVMSTLLHEVQHAIQRIEGFAEGYNDERAKTAQDAAQNLFDEAKNEYADILSDPENFEYNWELPNAVIQKVSALAKNNVNVISVTDPYTGTLYTNFGDQGMESRPAPKDRVEKGKMMWNLVNAYLYDLFEQKVISYEDYEALTGDELDTLIDAALDADYAFRMNGRTIDAFDLYQATHGEQEARQTAERMRMTPEERRQNRIIPPTEAETRDAKKLDKLPEKLTGRMMADDDEIEWERARYSVAEEGEQAAQEQPNLLTDVVQRMQAQAPTQSRFSAADAMDYEDWVQTKAPNDRQPISQEQINNTQNNRASREAVNIPRTGTKDGYVTDRNVQTIINSGITTDEAANAAKQALANGAYQHMEYHDEAALDKATKKIEYDGWAETLGQYRKDVMAGKASKDITAMGIALYNNAVTSGHIYDAMDIASLMIKNASSVGAALQASRMLNRLTPEGRLYMAVRSLENIANELRDLYGDQYHYDVDNALLDQYRNALIDGDEKAAKEAWHMIEKQIADQIPSDWKLKLNNWRYLAMLGNPRTHIRNIVGNLGFMPVQRAKQNLKAVLESMKMGQVGKDSGRTTAILNPFSSEDKALRKAAKDDYVNSVDLIQSGGKLSSTKGDIENLRTVYKSKFLEWLRKKNSELLDKEDTWFSRPAYAQALASFLKARGVSAADFTSGKVDANLLNEAREHAILEAQRATYRDTNEFSAWVSSLGKAGKRADAGKWQKAVSLATEAVLPFKKTPANILVRAIEYSPAEFAKVFFGDIKQVRAAQAETKKAEAESDGSEEALQKIASLKQQESSMVSDMLDHISSGLTGTALLGLGVLLRHLKIVSGGKDPDDEQAGFDDLHGQQEYSINLGGINYTIDWLAPEALPMFTGVTLYDRVKEMLSGEDRESDILSDIWDLVTGVGEPMLNMSMLSSVNDLVSKMSYLDDATQLPALLGQIGYGYISQYIPTLFGQVERITEAQRESTYYDRDDKLSKDLQYMLGKTANKIPVWDYNQIPYLDAWGQEQDSGNLLRRVFANMFSPGYIRERTTSDLDNELQRMHDLGYSKMLPERTTQSTKVDQEYMNEQEYVAYARLRGQTALADLTALTESKAYQNMTDEQKAKAISKIYSDARSLAEDEVRKMRGEKVKGTSAEKAGMNSATFSAAKTVYETANAPSWYNVTDENGEQKVPNWSKMLTVLNDNSFSKADRLKFVNGVSTRKEDFKTFDEAKTYYTDAEEDAKLDIKYSAAKDVYDNAKTPDGYKTTEAGNTPGWAKMLALLDSKSVSDTIKLEYINRVSGRKEPYASLDEARSYYEDSKKKAKK